MNMKRITLEAGVHHLEKDDSYIELSEKIHTDNPQKLEWALNLILEMNTKNKETTKDDDMAATFIAFEIDGAGEYLSTEHISNHEVREKILSTAKELQNKVLKLGNKPKLLTV